MEGKLEQENTALWVVDMQEKLMPFIKKNDVVIESVCVALKGAEIFKLPLIVTEQSPVNLGPTVEKIHACLPPRHPIFSKTSFSGYAHPEVHKAVEKCEATHWILVGVETHICILQTAKDLVRAGKKVSILQDGVSSRCTLDSYSALEELRYYGARVSTLETVFYELMKDASRPEFKQFLPFIKSRERLNSGHTC